MSSHSADVTGNIFRDYKVAALQVVVLAWVPSCALTHANKHVAAD